MPDEKNLSFHSWKYFFKVCKHLSKIFLVKYIFGKFTFLSCGLWSTSNSQYQITAQLHN